MKAKRFFSSFLCFFLVFCNALTTSIFDLSASAKTDDDAFVSSEASTSANCCNETSGTYLALETEKRHFLPDENIIVQYSVSTEESIADSSYSQTGFDVISVCVDEEHDSQLFVELSCVSTASNYQLTVQVALQSGNTLTASLYAIKNEYGTFISPFSEDDARERYFDYAIASDIMSLEECRAIRNEFAKRCVVEEISIKAPSTLVNGEAMETTSTASQDTYVQGQMRWIDDDGIWHPIRRAMVKIYDEDLLFDTLLTTVYTDDEGYFSYAFDNADEALNLEDGGYDIFIRVYAGDENALVKIGDSDEAYYYESDVSENIPTGSTQEYNLGFGMIGDLGRAFQISQAIITARDYAWQMMSEKPSDVTINYPDGDENCHYYSESQHITITGANRDNSSVPHSYASWDVIMHEYGHHVQHIVENTAANPGLDHWLNTNCADIYQSKDIGIHLAWGEAWPTVFGMQAQNYWGIYLQNIAFINDTTYDSYMIELPHEIESNTDYLGDGCEGAIIAVLWDLYDSNNEDNDTITLGHDNYWAVTTGDESKKFSDFVEYFYEQYPSYIDDIGLNLSYYEMATTAPCINNLPKVSQTVPPNFVWTEQGGSEKYPNNSFALIFYNSLGQEILRTPFTTSPEYTLTQSEWNSVLYSYGTTYTVAVAAMQTAPPITGAYISAQSVVYTKPAPSTLSQTVSVATNNRYTEQIANLQPGQYIEYNITFASEGTKLMQTFGSKDVKMYLYDENDVLLDWDDDSGYGMNALLSYDVVEDAIYTVRIFFYNGNEFGEVKFAIMPAASYSTYEDIHGCSEDVIEHGTALSQNEVKVLRYYVSETATVTFTLDADFDTFLYIINPRSTAPISSSEYQPSTYDDDSGGNLQARITKTLDPGVPYLVVLSAYNPSTQSGLCYITFE